MASAAGYHCEFGVTPLQIQPAHDAVMPLFDEKTARAGLELFLDQLELSLAETKALRILFRACIDIWEEHLGGCLLDDGAADGAVEHVAGTLGCEAHHG